LILLNQIKILEKLEEIVGKDFVSNKKEDLFIYSQDPGASQPRPVDYVTMPKTVDEIQKIVRLANEEKIPIIPMGGGLTLSGLSIPIKGGIVLDLKRMDEIIEIDELSRYALIEAGVTTGKLLSYLEKHHPNLEASIPDAPPSVTIAGNALINGSGFLSQKHEDHGSMINGLEVVLPNGEFCKLGSCAVSNYWFTRGPIPDFIGLFTSSFGTMGIATKLSIKLFPKPKLRDLIFGLFKDPKKIPKLLLKITHSEIAEDIILGVQDIPKWMKGNIHIIVFITGDNNLELETKKEKLNQIFREFNGNDTDIPEKLKKFYLEKPIFYSGTADFRKGGGFEYVGSFMPLEKIPDAILDGYNISNKHGIIPTIGCRVIGKCHTILYFVSYAFNRADPKDIQNARNALEDTNKMVLELGGIPWKAELDAQQLIIQKMDSNYKILFDMIRKELDPNGIMNPGNWEII